MLRAALPATAGAFIVQWLPSLPEFWALSSLLLLSAPLALFCGRYELLALLLGIAMLSSAAGAEIASRVPDQLTRKDIQLITEVIEFTIEKESGLQLLVRPIGAQGLPERIRLNWYDATAMPLPGDLWQFDVRLKRPRGYANPGSFDFEKFAHRTRLGATGYVLTDSTPLLLMQGAAPLSKLRIRAARRLDQTIKDGDAAAVARALAVGDRSGLSRSDWKIFAATGTTHLMAISGLHIGLAAGASFLLCWGALSLVASKRNMRDTAILVSCLCAAGYAALSGFGTPARRALAMLLLGSTAFLSRRRVDPWQLLAVAALLVIALDPLAVYAPGFLLSFAAVALLVLGAQRLPVVAAGGPLVAWSIQLLALQLALLFGMLAFTLAMFGHISLVAPLANMLVVPVFSFLVVPLVLLGLVLDGPLAAAGDLLLGVAGWLIYGVLRALGALAALSWSVLEPAAGAPLLIALLCSVRAILPAGFAGRSVSLLALLALLSWRSPRPPDNCFDLHVLDVGQGLAVSIETADSNLLYDTGPAWRSGSAAESTIGPYLAARGVRRIDTLVVSHADLDHAGGLRWLLANVSVRRLLSGEPGITGGTTCTGSWRRDGVLFRVLYPQPGEQAVGNNSSCVLEVSAGERRILLTGDIEAPVEYTLSRRELLRPADLVVVPHHGSRTSSTFALVKKLRPPVAIVAAAHANRWGFPKPDVVGRWQWAGAEVLVTASSGAVAGRFCAGEPVPRLIETRRHERRYWNEH